MMTKILVYAIYLILFDNLVLVDVGSGFLTLLSIILVVMVFLIDVLNMIANKTGGKKLGE